MAPFSFRISFSLWWSLFFVIVLRYCLKGECRDLEFPTYYIFNRKRLDKHVIKILSVPDMDICELQCYHEANCVSFNFETTSNNGRFKCELNNSTHMEHDVDLTNDVNYLYRGAKNNCGSAAPCQQGGTCQSGFSEKGYHCLCKTGFTGEHCDDGCQNYTSLTDADRKTSFQSRKSDSGLVPGWYRFEGEAGTKMPTSYPGPYRCNTRYAGWLDGDHPQKINQTTSKRVCFRSPHACCRWCTNIKVINCGSYYVYYLKRVWKLWIWRYCSED
ncbi:uromodulin-like [Acropora palmata]|uniref:uromodulin-like n=1 Tax=Acropora palmata TaxID=6131 RepID=UPI003DA1BAD2